MLKTFTFCDPAHDGVPQLSGCCNPDFIEAVERAAVDSEGRAMTRIVPMHGEKFNVRGAYSETINGLMDLDVDLVDVGPDIAFNAGMIVSVACRRKTHKKKIIELGCTVVMASGREYLLDLCYDVVVPLVNGEESPAANDDDGHEPEPEPARAPRKKAGRRKAARKKAARK